MISSTVRRLLRERVNARAEPLDLVDINGPVSRSTGRFLVFAPHSDDETPGSGGLIAILRDRAVPVHGAFMTDGAASHSPDTGLQRADVPKVEAVEAAARLGVDQAHLDFFEHADARLIDCDEVAITRLVGLLAQPRPNRIVLPQAIEPNVDHASTFRIADAAARAGGSPIAAIAYIARFWGQWSWTNPFARSQGRHGRSHILVSAVRGRLGFGIGRCLTHVLDISAVIDRKRSALAAHTTQMTCPEGDPSWITRSDVADGDWLDLLMRPHELYSITSLGT